MKFAAVMLFAAILPGAQVRLPDYSHEVLPNGAVLDVVPRRGVPLVSIGVFVKGGAESDPAGKAGLSSLTADLLRRGSSGRTAGQFEGELDSMGANFETRVTPQATRIEFRFLAKDTARALELLQGALLAPTFPGGEFKKAQAERIEQSKAVKEDPVAASAAYFASFFFGPQHPYGSRTDGDEISLARLSRADVTAVHSRMYVGKNLIVVAAGDFDAATMRAALMNLFSRFPAGEAYAWHKDPSIAAAAAPRMLLVNKPGSAQTYFWIGAMGITRTSPDRIPMQLVDAAFGGRFTSMLNDELRVNSGLTYGATSIVERDRLPGRVALFTYTRTGDTVKAIDLALEVVGRLHKQGLNAEQLSSTKAYVEGEYPTRHLETSEQLTDTLADLELFGLTRVEVDDLFARIDAVTPEQANEAAKRFLQGNLVFVLLGDAAKIREAVRKYAPSVVEVPVSAPGFPVVLPQ